MREGRFLLLEGWLECEWMAPKNVGGSWGSLRASAFLVRELSLRELKWKSCWEFRWLSKNSSQCQTSQLTNMEDEYPEEIG